MAANLASTKKTAAYPGHLTGDYSQAKIEALRLAIDAGLKSESTECCFEDFMADLEREDRG